MEKFDLARPGGTLDRAFCMEDDADKTQKNHGIDTKRTQNRNYSS